MWRQDDFDEALHALRYGAIAKEVNVQKTMNTRKPHHPPPKKASNEGAKHAGGGEVAEAEVAPAVEWEEVHVDDLVEELEGLRGEVYELQAKNAQLEATVRLHGCTVLCSVLAVTQQERGGEGPGTRGGLRGDDEADAGHGSRLPGPPSLLPHSPPRPRLPMMPPFLAPSPRSLCTARGWGRGRGETELWAGWM